MAWEDRLRNGAYNSPSGIRVTFDYEDVSRDIDKKTIGFTFPDADGTFVQDMGRTGRRYPLMMFFWGDDYDISANAFEQALLERGVGKLEHPLYGVIDVVPFGTIKRRDDLKTASNQAIIEVEFWETLGLIYPSSQSDPASNVVSSVEEFNEASAFDFSILTNIVSTLDNINLKNKYVILFDTAVSNLSLIANFPNSARNQFINIKTSIANNLETLFAIPETLGLQTILMIQTPAKIRTSSTLQPLQKDTSSTKIAVNIRDRLSIYNNSANDILVDENIDAIEFHTQDLYASAYLTGSILCVINHTFATKKEALSSAEQILTQFDDLTTWRENNFDALKEIDTGESYQKLQTAVALTAGFLVEISFTLKQERTIVIDRNRTIIDLCAEIYGSIDDNLDFLINSNDLSGSEILELPRNRSILYYV